LVTGKRDPSWISEGEKFALVGLSVQIDPALDRFDLPGGLTALANAEFELPDHWREWLGTLRVEEMEESVLFLLAKMPSTQAGVLDGENQLLQDRVAHWFGGLMLVAKFHQRHDSFLVSGSREAGEVLHAASCRGRHGCDGLGRRLDHRSWSCRTRDHGDVSRNPRDCRDRQRGGTRCPWGDRMDRDRCAGWRDRSSSWVRPRRGDQIRCTAGRGSIGTIRLT
jgi:hypothetical protein